MTNFVPVYPLETVIFPGEVYRLHISKDQYKHLITDCFGENKPFGILPVLQQKPADLGTLAEIDNVSEVWQDGRMNIRIKGIQVLRTLEIIKEIPQKLYSGAIVTYPDNVTTTNPTMTARILQSLTDFHRLIDFQPDFGKEESHINSYDMAHLAGLSLQQEFELLGLMFESQRLEYLRRHLLNTVPMLTHIHSMQRRYAQDKDYKNAKGFDFGKE